MHEITNYKYLHSLNSSPRKGRLVLYILGSFLLLLSSLTVAKGQSDSLVTIDGKILVGKYKKPVFGHSCFISEGRKIQLDPTLYTAYKSKGTWYGSVKVAENLAPIWMECLERGKITLYQYVHFGTGGPKKSPRTIPESQVVWLARKKGGPVLNVNGVMASSAQAKENLKRLLMDEPELLHEVDLAPFTTGVIRALIEGYNRRALSK